MWWQGSGVGRRNGDGYDTLMWPSSPRSSRKNGRWIRRTRGSRYCLVPTPGALGARPIGIGSRSIRPKDHVARVARARRSISIAMSSEPPQARQLWCFARWRPWSGGARSTSIAVVAEKLRSSSTPRNSQRACVLGFYRWSDSRRRRHGRVMTSLGWRVSVLAGGVCGICLSTGRVGRDGSARRSQNRFALSFSRPLTRLVSGGERENVSICVSVLLLLPTSYFSSDGYDGADLNGMSARTRTADSEVIHHMRRHRRQP